MFESIYHKLSRELENYFRQGEFGERLPGVLPLSKKFGVSKNSISKALHVLADRGVIVIESGRGMRLCRPSESPARRQHRVIGLSGFYDVTPPGGVSLLDKLNRKYRQYGYTLIGLELPHTLSRQKAAWLKQLPIDGVILLNSASHPFLLDFFFENNIPLIGGPLPGYEHLNSIEPDHYQTYCRIIRELTTLGHRRVGLVWFDPPAEFRFYFELILKAFKDTLGSDYDENLLWHPESYQDAYARCNPPEPDYTARAMAKFLSLPQMPTAVIGQTNVLKSLAGHAANAGLKVPEDLSLYAVCYPHSYDPFFHTAIVRDDISVETAFRRMISILNGRIMPPEQIFVPMTFKEGQSITKAKQ